MSAALGIAQLLVKAGIAMYPLTLPDSAEYPACTYQTISSVASYTLNGPLGLTVMRLQVDCWAKDYVVARAAADAVDAELDGYFGTLPNGVQVGNLQRESEEDLYEDEAFLYRIRTDWRVWYRQL